MRTDAAGFIALISVVAFLSYYIPSKVRSKTVVGEARTSDRYSPSMRIVTQGHQQSIPQSGPSGGAILPKTRPPSEIAMSSPVARKLAAADARRIAAAKAAHAATVSRRQAATRRRRVLLGALLLTAVVMLVLGATTGFPMWPAAIPTALAGAVAYAGFRAAQAAKVADAKWEEELIRIQQPLATRTRVPIQRSARPAQENQASLRIDVDPASLFIEEEKPAEKAESTWTPVPVPAPTYTLKPAAPRRTVAAYEVPAQDVSAQEIPAQENPTQESLAQGSPARKFAPPAATTVETHEPARDEQPADSGDAARTVNVREVLARRRAAG